MRPGGGDAELNPGWRVRVVPNLYPALTTPKPRRDGSTAADAARRQPDRDLFWAAPGAGAHEVIVNRPGSRQLAGRARRRRGGDRGGRLA